MIHTVLAQKQRRHSRIFGLWQILAQAFLQQQERWVFWAPVCFGFGAGVYLCLSFEPVFWVAPSIAAGLLIAAWFLRYHLVIPYFMAGLGLLAAGFALSDYKASSSQMRFIDSRGRIVTVTGQLELLEQREEGMRITLSHLCFVLKRNDSETCLPEITHRLRLKIRPSQIPAQAGQRISVRAIFSPPSPPSMPGSFDFRRQSWFRHLVAVGFAVSAPEMLEDGLQNKPKAGGALFFTRLREQMQMRIMAHMSRDTGAVASALVIGEQGAVSSQDLEAMRLSGLTHILSVSGLHLSMVAGLFFFLIRRFLSLIPILALRYDIKKIAAFLALIGTTLYTLLVGAPVPTQRSLLMISLLLLAVMTDRVAFSPRAVAIAAMVVLVLNPFSAVDASFQMSFAAAAALVACFEVVSQWFTRRKRESSRLGRLYHNLLLTLLTSLVASLATAVPALYHFQRMAPHGIVANLIGVPLTGYWIMPFAMVSAVTMIFGLEAWPLRIMAVGVDGLLKLADIISRWPMANFMILPPSPIGFAIAMFGMCWLCLWRGYLRLWGVAIIFLAGMVGYIGQNRPDIIVSQEGDLVAVRLETRDYSFSTARNSFDADNWQRRLALSEISMWPEAGESQHNLRCDAGGCILMQGDIIISLAQSQRSIAEDCHLADIIISPQFYASCPGKKIYDKKFLKESGAFTLDFGDIKSVRQQTVNGQIDRPWTKNAISVWAINK